MSAEMTLPSSSSDRLMFWASVRVKPGAEHRHKAYRLAQPVRAQAPHQASISRHHTFYCHCTQTQPERV